MSMVEDDAQKLSKSGLFFAVDIFKKCAESHDNNLVISPFSINVLLSMALVGAKTETAEEMKKVMHLDMFNENIHEEFENNILSPLSRIPYIELNIANRMYFDKNINLLDEFKIKLTKYYRALSCPVNFKNFERTTIAINQWVEDQTKGNWTSKFDPKNTEQLPYYGGHNKETPVNYYVDMMSTVATFRYAETLNCQMLELPYGRDERISMIIILPKLVYGGLQFVKEHLSADLLKLLQRQMVRVYLPKFNVETYTSLSSILSAMGIKRLFNNADLSGMSIDRDLFVSSMIQKAVIEVNEKGTVAAATTSMDIADCGGSSDYPIFNANHPFIFLVLAKDTKSVLFIGQVSKPQMI